MSRPPNPPRVPPRVSDEDLRTCLHPDERMISPVWSNAHLSAWDIAADLRDARARITALEAALGVAEQALRRLFRIDGRTVSFLSAGDIPMDMSPKRQRIVRSALEAIRSEGGK